MKFIVIGGKGTAVNIAEAIIDAGKKFKSSDELLGFAIDDPALGCDINGIPIVCKVRDLNEKYAHYADVKYLFALYKPSVMRSRVDLLNSLNLPIQKFANFIHPSAYISVNCNIGVGNVLLHNVCINANVNMGNFNVLNQSVIIEHDTSIGNSNFFAAGAIIGSHVSITNGNFMGIHSSVRENVVMGSFNILGMGGVLLSSVNTDDILAGIPAKSLRNDML